MINIGSRRPVAANNQEYMQDVNKQATTAKP